MEQDIRPLHNYLIIDKLEDELHSVGGIALVKADKHQPRIARVLAIGPGVLEEGEVKRCGVDVGDKVAYLAPEAKTFNVNNEDVTFLRGSGVLGKVG